MHFHTYFVFIINKTNVYSNILFQKKKLQIIFQFFNSIVDEGIKV